MSGKKSPPSSALKNGKSASKVFVVSPNKDNRNQLHYKGTKEGVVGFWVKKHNTDEEPFLLYDIQFLRNNDQTREELGIALITTRKGHDGATALLQSPGSSYNWTLWVMLLGDDQNTAANRKDAAKKLLEYFNANANSQNYTYPRKMKLGADHTGSRKGPVDTLLLDKDVIGLMAAAYPTTPLDELIEFKEIMQTFWMDVAHGKEVVENYNAIGNGNNTNNEGHANEDEENNDDNADHDDSSSSTSSSSDDDDDDDHTEEEDDDSD